MLGWEAFRLRAYQEALPAIDYQLSKLSPVSLGRAKREEKEDSSKLSEEERKRRRQEEQDRKLGEPILERIRRQAHFRLMPEFLQAADVRKHGWIVDDEPKEIEGMSPQVAKEIIALGRSGALPESDAYWAAYGRLRVRLHATAGVR